MHKNLIKILSKVAGKEADKDALLYKKDGVYTSISYKELREKILYFASGLISIGINKGDKAAIISENRPEWAIADYGIIHTGALTVPIYPSLPENQMEYILKTSGAKYVIASDSKQCKKINNICGKLDLLKYVISLSEPEEEYTFGIKTFDDIIEEGKKDFINNKKKLDELSEQIDSDDVFTIIFTSGTTDNPKGVELTHGNVLSNIEGALNAVEITREYLFLSFLPLAHILERTIGQFLPLYLGASIAYAESLSTLKENIIEIRPTIILSVPRIFEKMYEVINSNLEKKSPLLSKILFWSINCGIEYKKRKGKVSITKKTGRIIADKLLYNKLKKITGGRLKFYVSAGAHLQKEIGEFFDSAGITIIEGYGLTETSPCVAVNRLNNYKFGTVGKPLASLQVNISNDGEILVKGPSVMKGYYNDEESTKQCIDEDGWFHTGDLGFIDKDGFLNITDRKKNIIVISSGKNISPQKIEDLLMSSKYINQAIALGHKKKFITALIVPNFHSIISYAKDNEIHYQSCDELIDHGEIYALIKNEIDAVSKHLSDFEKIKKFTFLAKEFSIESEELTPTLKIKRNIIENKYADIINKMYM
ncbi:AMP-dependent synthetase/ligase [candidate division KSB1 bacterium]